MRGRKALTLLSLAAVFVSGAYGADFVTAKKPPKPKPKKTTTTATTKTATTTAPPPATTAPATPPPVAAPPPPASPPPPPAPPPPSFRTKGEGASYQGQTSQSYRISFTVGPNERSIVSLRYEYAYSLSCDSSGRVSVVTDDRVTVDADGRFVSKSTVSKNTFAGKFDGDGRASGTFERFLKLTGGRECTTGIVTWSAN